MTRGDKVDVQTSGTRSKEGISSVLGVALILYVPTTSGSRKLPYELQADPAVMIDKTRKEKKVTTTSSSTAAISDTEAKVRRASAQHEPQGVPEGANCTTKVGS